MTDSITRLFGHTISSDAWDRKFGQVVCFVAAAIVCLVSMWQLTRLDLTEVELFFGLLLSLCVPLLLFLVGLVLPLASSAWKQQS